MAASIRFMKWHLAAPLVLMLASPDPAHADKKVLPFIEDDYARALGSARAHELPLFVEVWAPW